MPIPTVRKGKEGEQRAEFEKLTDQQRSAVLTKLFPGTLAPVETATNRTEALEWARQEMQISDRRWAEPKVRKHWEENLDEAIEAALQPPPEPEPKSEDDEDDSWSWDEELVKKRAAKKSKRRNEERQPKTKPAPQTARGYAALPYLVLDRLLSVMPDAALKVYCALLRFEGYKSGQMWPGYDRLAEMTGLGAVTIWRSVKLLREVGLVTSRRRFGTSNLYEHVVVTSKNVEEIEAKLRARPIRKMRAADKRRVRASVPSRSEGSVPSRMKG